MGQKVGKLLPVSFFFLLSLAAQVSKKERQAWFKMVKDYFFHSNNLRRVFLLIDSRHGIKPSDIDLMKILEEAAITFQLENMHNKRT